MVYGGKWDGVGGLRGGVTAEQKKTRVELLNFTDKVSQNKLT